MSPNQVVTSSQEPYGLVKIHFLFPSGPSGLMLPTLSTGKGMCILATKYFPVCECCHLGAYRTFGVSSLRKQPRYALYL